MTTVNETTTCECLEAKLEILSLDEQGSIEIRKAYTTKKFPIDCAEPSTELQLGRWKHLKCITLPTLQSNLVGIIIGVYAPDTHLVLEERLGDRKHPFDLRMHLGWIIMGSR